MPVLLSVITTMPIPNMNYNFMIGSPVCINGLCFVSNATREDKKQFFISDDLQVLDLKTVLCFIDDDNLI